jgi:DNA-binding response OmpR family regulator
MKHPSRTHPAILLLEDDRLFAETLTDFLSEEGYAVTMVLDPYTAEEKTFSQRYDLYLFDINLPFESGLELLKKLREGEDRTPTIFLTSREDKGSLLAGFDVGGDDYLRKPIDLDELRVRIEAVLRRREGRRRISLGEYEADVVAKQLYRDGGKVELGVRLFDLLMLMVGAHGQAVTMDRIMEELWAPDQEPSYGALRVYITRLKKLFGHRIENVRGVGYRFVLNPKEKKHG